MPASSAPTRSRSRCRSPSTRRITSRSLPTSPKRSGPNWGGRRMSVADVNVPRMAYDEDLAYRIRELVAAERGVEEKRMFGGLAFLINGNMSVAASGQGGLLVRVDPADTPALVQRPEASRFEMRGRHLNGWLRIDPSGLATNRQLKSWVSRGVGYARSLPGKPPV